MGLGIFDSRMDVKRKMIKIEKTVAEFLDDEVKKFSIHVLKERALPNVIDGFKPSQRKIIFTTQRVATSFMKTSSLSGYVSPIGGYDKGDGSIPPTIVKMVQDYVGANNVPFLEGDGSFGGRFIPDGASAPRYTKTRLHKSFNQIFKDKEILKYTEVEGETHEPDYFLPIIPTLLLNGISGIAVGFACEFQPYNIKDIKKNIQSYLKGIKMVLMKPYFKGFKGTVVLEDEKFVMYGVVENINTTKFRISEIPTGNDYSREKYINKLNKLIDKGLIKDFTDGCNKNGFDFEIICSREQTAKLNQMDSIDRLKFFKLRKVLNENLNAISENNELLIFKDVNEIIKYFVDFRLKTLTERKSFKIKSLTEELSITSAKIKFIMAVWHGDINLEGFGSKKAIIDFLKSEGHKQHTEILVDIPIYKLTSEESEELIIKSVDIHHEIKYYKSITENELFEKDLEGI